MKRIYVTQTDKYDFKKKVAFTKHEDAVAFVNYMELCAEGESADQYIIAMPVIEGGEQ